MAERADVAGRPGDGLRQSADAERTPRRATRPLRWWRELLYAIAFYGVYSAIRDLQGSRAVPASLALANARIIIGIERSAGVFAEIHVQRGVLRIPGLIEAANVFYGTAHFAITVGVLIWLFRRHPDRYPQWRTALAATTAMALVGFAAFPVMPPRLLPATYGFVDTLARYPTLWSFNSPTMERLSNQYAAMPSLHLAWAGWAALAAASCTPRRHRRLVIALYPATMVVVVLATANHYIADLMAGIAIVGLAALVSGAVHRRRSARVATHVVEGETPRLRRVG